MATDLKDITLCPVCGRPVGLFSRNEGYISLGCDRCSISRTVPVEEWNAALSRARGWPGFSASTPNRRLVNIPVAQDRRRPIAE